MDLTIANPACLQEVCRSGRQPAHHKTIVPLSIRQDGPCGHLDRDACSTYMYCGARQNFQRQRLSRSVRNNNVSTCHRLSRITMKLSVVALCLALGIGASAEVHTEYRSDGSIAKIYQDQVGAIGARTVTVVSSSAAPSKTKKRCGKPVSAFRRDAAIAIGN